MELSLEGLSVMIALPVNRALPWQTHRSLMRTACELKDRGVKFLEQPLVGGSIVQYVRSCLATEFLCSDYNRLFWTDSDQSWEPADFIKVLALSTKMPVIGAAYPAKREPIEFLLNFDSGPVTMNEYGCIPIKGMGLGFTCVQRQVIEHLAEDAPKVANDKGQKIAMMFRVTIEDGKYIGEDMNFFLDAQAKGYGTFCDPSIEIGHVGDKEYKARLMDALQKLPSDNGVKAVKPASNTQAFREPTNTDGSIIV